MNADEEIVLPQPYGVPENSSLSLAFTNCPLCGCVLVFGLGVPHVCMNALPNYYFGQP
jgi:hypothetical protein